MQKKQASSHTPRSPQKRKKVKQTKKGHKTIIICLVVAVLLAGVAFWILMPLARSNATIIIPAGATSSQVEEILARHTGAAHAARVMAIARVAGRDFSGKAMRVEVSKGSIPPLTLWRMLKAARMPVKVVINGFRTRVDVENYIERTAGIPAHSIDSMLNDKEWLSSYELTPENAMAIMLNYTHEVYYGSSVETLMEKIGNAYLSFWTPSRREIASKMGLSPVELTTVASIAEEESAQREERGRIGRLYINRLHKNMRLQADPTVRFALGDFAIKRITNDMLAISSPYNTYRNGGLPPGPIRTVDPATIISILQSPPSDDIYMCARADFSGFHNFASTYQEHLKNAAAYRKALDERDIH